MSYILDALKKSERDRHLGHVPDLDTVQDMPVARANRWPWIIGAMLTLNAAVGVVFIIQQSDRSFVPPPPAIAKLAPPVPAPLPSLNRPEPVAPRPVLNPTPASVTEQTPVGQELAPDTAPPPAPVAVPRQVPRPLVTPSENVEESPVLSQVPQAAASADPPETLALVEPPADPFVPEPEPPAPKVSATDWEDMSAAFRAKVARPQIDVHVYSELPEQRFVLLELEKYREGERLSSGLVIQTITPHGVVFFHQGTRFHVARP